jgi:hypothetical protein
MADGKDKNKNELMNASIILRIQHALLDWLVAMEQDPEGFTKLCGSIIEAQKANLQYQQEYLQEINDTLTRAMDDFRHEVTTYLDVGFTK